MDSDSSELTYYEDIELVIDTPQIQLAIAIIDLTRRDYINAFGKWTEQRRNLFNEMQQSRHVFFPRTPAESQILHDLCEVIGLNSSVFKKHLHDDLLLRLNELPAIPLKVLGIKQRVPNSI